MKVYCIRENVEDFPLRNEIQDQSITTLGFNNQVPRFQSLTKGYSIEERRN